MADTENPPPPFLFRRLEPVSSDLHRNLRLNKIGYGFAAGTSAVPIGLNEFATAGHEYPIVFTAVAEPAAVAMVGYKIDQNLFVDSEGKWRPDTYIPAYLRAYPFTMVELMGQNRWVLGLDTESDAVSSPQGEPLFNDGQASPRLKDILSFCESVATSLRRMQSFGKDLLKANLLTPHEATLTFGDGSTERLGGFLAVDREALNKMPDRKFLDLRRRGMLPLIEAHLHSLDRWNMLARVATQRLGLSLAA